MLKSGDFFLAGSSGGVIGAIVPWGRGYAGVAPAHVLELAGTDVLRIGTLQAKVIYRPKDADLAFFPILAACKLTELEKPSLGDAVLENSARKINCRISEASWSVAYVVLPPNDLPGPGDSGTPLLQNGRVVGMLLSLNMHTCKGIAVSADAIKRAATSIRE
jgi:hypothetical protein